MVALVVAVQLWGGTVAAHAELLEVVPGDGAVVPEAPTGVTLRFSEAVSLVGGSVRVLDDAGTVVADDAQVAEDTVTVALPPLEDGTFTVAWQIVSQDSHRISGASLFHVGAPSSDEVVVVDGTDDDLPWSLRAGTTALTAIAYAATMLAVGLAWFATAIARAGPEEGWSGPILRSAVIAIVALVVAFPARAARLGGGIDALADAGFLASTLRGPLGVSTAVTALGLAALLVVIGRATQVPIAAVIGIGLVALGGFAIEGHTRTSQPQALGLLSDVVHLAAGAVWLGGIAGLVIALRPSPSGPRWPERRALDVVARFSTAALGAVVVVAAAGIALSLLVLPAVSDLWSTSYGWTLLVKVALVAAVVALGAWNRSRLRPGRAVGAAASPLTLRRHLARVVTAELGVLLVVVGVTAVLVGRSPNESEAAPPPPAVAAEVTLSNGVGSVDVATPPTRTGYFEMTMTLTGPDGAALVPFEPPAAALEEPAQGLGPLALDVHEVGAGEYHVFGSVPTPGDWQLQLDVRLTEFDLAAGVLNLVVR